jgi:drug/metabolite transporter (DMT)-like permease
MDDCPDAAVSGSGPPWFGGACAGFVRRAGGSMNGTGTHRWGAGDPARSGTAILCMIGSVSLLTVLDSIAKFLVEGGYPVLQTVWARYFFHLVPMIAALPFTGWRSQGHSVRPLLQSARALILVCGTLLFLAGLQWLPLAQAYTISYVSPLIATLLGAAFLGERVGRIHWAAILLGLGGVLVVMQPGGTAFQWAMLLPLCMACTFALFQVSTRVINQSDPPLVTLFYTGLVGTIATGALLPLFWVQPAAKDIPLFISLGIVGLLSHILLVRAYRLAGASILAPFTYTQLPIAAFLGYLVFSDMPTLSMLGGGILIVASGIIIFYVNKNR